MNTILVVDDSLDIQASLKFFIEDEGHHYHGVLTPESACEYVVENTVDLVLLDMNLNQNTTSGEEGLATIDKLLKLDAHLPIVVMTGWATMTLAIDALRRGASDFIEKPWQDERLSQAISNLLEKRRDKQDLARLSEENKRLTPQPSFSEHAYSIEKKSVLDKLAHLAKSDMKNISIFR